LSERRYTIGQFARRASVSIRTLRYYEEVGLLAPTAYSEGGRRLYSDADLPRLQHILALKFLGFSLDAIRVSLEAGAQHLPATLAAQKAMMQERRAQLDRVIEAIGALERAVAAGSLSWDALVHTIGVIQMDQTNDWVQKYFSPEQQETMRRLGERAYSDAAKRTIASREGAWTEADQRRVDAQYAALAADLRRLVAQGADPASDEAQAAAARKLELEHAFTQGDPEVRAGLQRWWEQFQALPDDQRPPVMAWGEAEETFIRRALAVYQRRQNDLQ
jgi:DNA-binding transcriptional MerR regulator